MKDFLGISLSLACLLHCTLVPLALLAGLAWAGPLEDERFHKVLTIGIVLVASWAFTHGLTRHRNKLVFACAVIGVALLISALFAEHRAEILLTVIASLLLVGAHTLNWILQRQTPCPTSH